MAKVLERTTKEIRTGVDAADFRTEEWVIDPVFSPASVETDVAAKYWKIEGDDSITEMAQGDKDTIDAADLATVKAVKDRDIDERTEELIDAGFSYDSQTFSLSANAQINWLGLEQKADDETYPMVISTKDEQAYSIASATVAHELVQAAFDTKKGHIFSGASLKAQVAAATTVAAVDAIVDNR